MHCRSAFLLEGVSLDAPLDVPPFTVTPVSPERKFIGRDGCMIFNAELADAGFVTQVGQPAWAVQIWPRRKLALAVCGPVEAGADAALQLASMANALADALALSHGGEPRVVASVVERSDDGDVWRAWMVMLGGGRQPGSTLDRLAEGTALPALDPARILHPETLDMRLLFWLSLFRGAASEARWDTRVFRLCALLETVAAETFPTAIPVTDENRRAILDEGLRPVMTGTAWGAMYMLVRRAIARIAIAPAVVCAHPSETLWHEVGVWVSVRNAVAHEGAWRQAPQPTRYVSRRDRTAAAFAGAGHGDEEAGWIRYADCCLGATEAVLRAAVSGHLASRGSPEGPGAA